MSEQNPYAASDISDESPLSRLRARVRREILLLAFVALVLLVVGAKVFMMLHPAFR